MGKKVTPPVFAVFGGAVGAFAISRLLGSAGSVPTPVALGAVAVACGALLGTVLGAVAIRQQACDERHFAVLLPSEVVAIGYPVVLSVWLSRVVGGFGDSRGEWLAKYVIFASLMILIAVAPPLFLDDHRARRMQRWVFRSLGGALLAFSIVFALAWFVGLLTLLPALALLRSGWPNEGASRRRYRIVRGLDLDDAVNGTDPKNLAL